MKNLKPSSRRDLLKLGIAVSLALVLVACSPAPTATPPPTPTAAPTATPTPLPTATLLPTVTPTAAPTATLTPTPKPSISLAGLPGVPYPEESLVRAGLEKFGLASQGLSAGNLIYEQRPNLNDPNKTPIIFARDPATKEIVLATRLNQQTKELEWHVAGLRDLADVLGIIIGTHFSSDNYPSREWESIDRLVIDQFNGVLLDNTAWHITEQQEGVFVFDSVDGRYEKSADARILKAISYNLFIRGDHIVNPPSNFDSTYLRDMTDLTPERLLQIMKNHIRGLMAHFKGKINLYGVVNESRPPDTLKPDGRPYDMFNVIIGESYIEEAFRIARETDPSAILIYNETRDETKKGYYGELYQRTKDIIDRLAEKGLVDGVGAQMHVDGSSPPRKQDIIEAFRSYGVPVCITEFDVDMSKVSGSAEERNERQARIYREIVEACLESGVCKQIWFWDVFDKYSWIDEKRGGNPNADPTMFNDSLQAKPAYFAVRKVLSERLTQK